MINDASCVVNFQISQDGSWTNATLERSSDGVTNWQPTYNNYPVVGPGQVAGVAFGPCNELPVGPSWFRAHGQDSVTGNDVYSDPFPFVVDVQSCGDTTPPTIFSGPTLSQNPISEGATVTLSWVASDSGNAPVGEYWIDADPGVGNGIQVQTTPNFSGGGNFSTQISGLAAGTHTIGVRAQDTAGNWSQTKTTTLTVLSGTASGTVSAGGTLTTDPSGVGATADTPVQTAVTLPSDSGSQTVSITEQSSTDAAPSGFSFFGNQVVIDNGGTTTSASDPYVLSFTIDSSLLGTVAPTDVQVFRDGVAIAPCADTTAGPDGVCVAGVSATDGGDAVVTIRTTHFSRWNFGKPSYAFGGFFQPVDNLPTVNTAKAGAAIPVKFSLGGNKGLNVFSSGYPAQASYNCTSAVTDAIETTVTAGNSSLSYDASTNTYTYVWKTDKAWASSCRELTLRFKDGTVKKAHFQLSK